MAHSNRFLDSERSLDAERQALHRIELELEAQDAELERAARALAGSPDGATVTRSLCDALRSLGEEAPAPPTLRLFATPPLGGARC